MIATKGAGGLPTASQSFSRKIGKTQTAGFEPAHAEHTRLAGEPRNHLGTSAAGNDGNLNLVVVGGEVFAPTASGVGMAPFTGRVLPWCSG